MDSPVSPQPAASSLAMGARVAWVDATAGVAGDMLLGALVDLGVAVEDLQRAVDAVIPDTVSLEAREARRCGQRATKIDVKLLKEDQPHRHATEILRLIDDAELHPDTRASARGVVEALASAEARAHGVDREHVHFHEVGAWDSIADIVGVCEGLRLIAGQVAASPVTVGFGRIRAAHGDMPVPVPAVAELARGIPVAPGDVPGEAATPTGVALLGCLAGSFGTQPAGTIVGVGVGAGTRDPDGLPNVTRILLIDAAEGWSGTNSDTGTRVVVEANVDDLDPRLWPGVIRKLMAAGAADAWLSPILMKKGRPAHTVTVLVDPHRVDAVCEVLFTATSTLGVRTSTVWRVGLDREIECVTVAGQRVRVKVARRGGAVVNRQPEFDDVAAAARALGITEAEMLELVRAAL